MQNLYLNSYNIKIIHFGATFQTSFLNVSLTKKLAQLPDVYIFNWTIRVGYIRPNPDDRINKILFSGEN